MSDAVLARRVLREHRRLVLPLTIALVVNIALFAFVVYPLSQRVANIAQRESAAAAALAAARKEHTAALGTLTGKDRAAAELTRFYKDVLPGDLASARRLTHKRIPDVAEQFDVEWYNSSATPPVAERGSSLVRYTTKLDLAGRYRDVRTFIHALETAPEFVVIDDISLREEDAEDGLLQLALQLSTYYKAAE
jgi:Tfp pilus assembly protein PilO